MDDAARRPAIFWEAGESAGSRCEASREAHRQVVIDPHRKLGVFLAPDEAHCGRRSRVVQQEQQRSLLDVLVLHRRPRCLLCCRFQRCQPRCAQPPEQVGLLVVVIVGHARIRLRRIVVGLVLVGVAVAALQPAQLIVARPLVKRPFAKALRASRPQRIPEQALLRHPGGRADACSHCRLLRLLLFTAGAKHRDRCEEQEAAGSSRTSGRLARGARGVLHDARVTLA